MTYDEFKAFVVTYLWRDGDADLLANLDNLIKMAHATIRVDLRLREQLDVDVASATTPNYTFTPNRIRYVKSVKTKEEGTFTYISPSDMLVRRVDITNDSAIEPVYSLDNRAVMLLGGFDDQDNGRQVFVEGYIDVPDFSDMAVTSTYLADNFLDLYLYAVLTHVAGFLREDERVAQFKQLYTDAVTRAMDSDKMFRDPPRTAPLPLPYPASPPRYRNWRRDL